MPRRRSRSMRKRTFRMRGGAHRQVSIKVKLIPEGGEANNDAQIQRQLVHDNAAAIVEKLNIFIQRALNPEIHPATIDDHAMVENAHFTYDQDRKFVLDFDVSDNLSAEEIDGFVVRDIRMWIGQIALNIDNWIEEMGGEDEENGVDNAHIDVNNVQHVISMELPAGGAAVGGGKKRRSTRRRRRISRRR